MQHIATQLPDIFTYAKGVTKSHILAANATGTVVVPIDDKRSVKLEIRQKHRRPIGGKDKNPQKGKKKKPALPRESLKEKGFSQRAIANNDIN